MGRQFSISAAQLFAMLLVLLGAYPNAAATSAISTTESTGQTLSNRATPSSTTQYSWYYCYPRDDSWCYPYYWSYYWWYYPYYYEHYYPTTAAETTRTFELKVETNPLGIAPVNGRGTYNQGSIASFSLTSHIVPSGTNQRYIFSYWSGDFSGPTPSGVVTMDSAKTVIANYELQNYLKVSIDPPGIAAAVGEGWYRSGESVVVEAAPRFISGGEGTRYVFQHWTIDAVPVSGNTVQVTMDAPHTVVARYKTQYLLAVASQYGLVQGGGWYDASSTATFSVTTHVEASYGVKEVFDRWTGDSESTFPTGTITMDLPHTVRAVWRTDRTILYATIALGIGGAFALGMGLAPFAITRQPRAEPTPAPPLRPVEKLETAPEKLKTSPTKKKVKAPPKTNRSETASQA